MAKIPLTIDKNYCSNWGAWHGIRELLQNAADAQDYEDKPMHVKHSKQTLEIRTENAYVDPANLLVLGRTSKADGGQRGKFGEGFVLGVLALVRKGCDVRFRNGEMSWSAAFERAEEGHPLEGNELLTFKSRQLKNRERDFTIEIDGINQEVWDLVKAKVLFLSPPNPEDTLVTDQGTLLLAAKHRGEIFVKGLFVRSFEDLACGYDLKDIPLDRDRQMINEWELHYALGRTWSNACAKNPSMSLRLIYQIAEKNAPDVKNLKYHADKVLLNSIKERFEQSHGYGAIPVASNGEAEEVERIGGKPALVSPVLRELLNQGGLTLESARKRLESEIVRRFTPSELDETSRTNLERVQALFGPVIVVEYRSPDPSCHVIDNKTALGVDHRLLCLDYRKILSSVARSAAQLREREVVDVLLDCLASGALQSKCDEESLPF